MSRETEMQPLVRFCLDGGTQMRLEIDESVVAEYAEAMKNGATFPPVVAFDDGSRLWLADGFHRYRACKLLDKSAIATDRRDGSQRDAVLFSLGANSAHGLRRSNADKRKAVETMLTDTQWSQWSGREIAKRCGVDEKTVRNIRNELHAENPQNETSQQRTFIHSKTGKETVMDTATVGGKSSSDDSKGEKRRLAGIKSRLPQDADLAARDIMGVMGLKFCQALTAAMQNIFQNSQEQE